MTVRLRVIKIFRFSDGRTVFCGTLSTEVPFLNAKECLVFINNAPWKKLSLEGEMFPRNRQNPEIRAVSTSENVDLSENMFNIELEFNI